jgi:hypothetical protein
LIEVSLAGSVFPFPAVADAVDPRRWTPAATAPFKSASSVSNDLIVSLSAATSPEAGSYL